MTIKLYDKEPYASEFEATVTESVIDGELYRIVLDQTLFFPMEGGQSEDKGTLNGLEVCKVLIDTKTDIIYHYVKGSLTLNEKVTGKIDFEHRYRNMQMHSGEHIFSGTVHNLFGYNNAGFHLSENGAHMDFDHKLSKEDILKVEEIVNRVIYSNVEIKTYYPSKDELAEINYRSKKEIEGDVRLVEIPGTDICACCAPHVHKTGEIGIFKVIGFENYKGGVRVYYLCGLRALEHYNKEIDTLLEISQLTSAKKEEEAKKVREIYEENRDLKVKLLTIENELLETQIQANVNRAKESFMVLEPQKAHLMKFAMELLHKYYSDRCVVLCGDDENGYRFFIESENEDLTLLLKTLKENLNMKGGGKPSSIQGNFDEKLNEIRKIV